VRCLLDDCIQAAKEAIVGLCHSRGAPDRIVGLRICKGGSRQEFVGLIRPGSCAWFGGHDETNRRNKICGEDSGPLSSCKFRDLLAPALMGNNRKTCDSEGLKKVWAEVEAVAKANGNMDMLYDVFPLVLGTSDKSYEGGNDFPPLPGVVPYAIKYWFGRRHAGAWRFNPCNYWGKPVPLPMLPENQGSH